jgi:hypothetical protein
MWVLNPRATCGFGYLHEENKNHKERLRKDIAVTTTQSSSSAGCLLLPAPQ